MVGKDDIAYYWIRGDNINNRDTMAKDWKEIEKIVAKIEDLISENCTVEHNVYLPNLNSDKGLTRQCDVVITCGKSPRKTISIVEVQDRNTKVDIVHFDGWVQKMRDVGAQHLICVSRKGFPESVIEKAKKIGPTVRLVELEEIDHIGALPYTELTFVHYVISEFHVSIDKGSSIPNNFTLEVQDKIFLFAGKKCSILDIASYFIYKNEDTIPENDVITPSTDDILSFSAPDEGHLLYILYQHKSVKVTFHAEIKYSRLVYKAAIRSFTYKQIGTDPFAWFLIAEVDLDGKKEQIQIPMTYSDNNFKIKYYSKINITKLSLSLSFE